MLQIAEGVSSVGYYLMNNRSIVFMTSSRSLGPDNYKNTYIDVLFQSILLEMRLKIFA